MSATEHTAHGSEPGAGRRADHGRPRPVRSDRGPAGRRPPARRAWSSRGRALAGAARRPVQPAAPSYAWVSSIGAPVRRRRAVPRLFLEVLFLVGVAAAATLAELDAPAIAGLMAGSWVLVALIEWAGSRADRRRDVVPADRADRAGGAAARRSVLVRAARRAHARRACRRLADRRHAAPAAPQDIDATVERAPDA